MSHNAWADHQEYAPTDKVRAELDAALTHEWHARIGLVGDPIAGKTREGVELDLFGIDLDNQTKQNTDYRRVVFTSEKSQLVLMSVEPDEDLPFETHASADQFFKVEQGSALVTIREGKESRALAVQAGGSIMVQAGVNHRVTNTERTTPLKMYVIYSPPVHPGSLRQPRQSDVDEELVAELQDKEFSKELVAISAELPKLIRATAAVLAAIEKPRTNLNSVQMYNERIAPLLRASATLVALLKRDMAGRTLVNAQLIGGKDDPLPPTRADRRARLRQLADRVRGVQDASQRTSALASRIFSFNTWSYAMRIEELWAERNSVIIERAAEQYAILNTERSQLLRELAAAKADLEAALVAKDKFLGQFNSILEIGAANVPTLNQLNATILNGSQARDYVQMQIKRTRADGRVIQQKTSAIIAQNRARCERDIRAYREAGDALQTAVHAYGEMVDEAEDQLNDEMQSADSEMSEEANEKLAAGADKAPK